MGRQQDGLTEFSAFLPDNEAAGPDAFVIYTARSLNPCPLSEVGTRDHGGESEFSWQRMIFKAFNTRCLIESSEQPER